MTPLRHPQEVAQMPFIWGNIVATPPGSNAHSHHIVASPPGDYKYITIIYIYSNNPPPGVKGTPHRWGEKAAQDSRPRPPPILPRRRIQTV